MRACEVDVPDSFAWIPVSDERGRYRYDTRNGRADLRRFALADKLPPPRGRRNRFCFEAGQAKMGGS